MDFTWAKTQMKLGNKCKREGWTDADAFTFYLPDLGIPRNSELNKVLRVNSRLANVIGENTDITVVGYFAKLTGGKKYIMGWVGDADDQAAQDWVIIE